jgi:hypothetical protein
MYSLHVIHQINAKAATAPKAETDATRRCSFHASRGGVVLHSARTRSTGFLSAGTKATTFLAEWHATNSAVKRDAVVEAYFRTIPTGKQKVSA